VARAIASFRQTKTDKQKNKVADALPKLQFQSGWSGYTDGHYTFHLKQFLSTTSGFCTITQKPSISLKCFA